MKRVLTNGWFGVRHAQLRRSLTLQSLTLIVSAVLGLLSVPLTSLAADVVGYELVSSVRAGRTTIDYTYRIRVSNPGPALTDAIARVVSTNAATQILDSEVPLGNLAANANVLSSDTFTLRQERTLPFTPSSLVWTVSGSTASVSVPNVVDLTQAAASTALTNAGLVVGTVTQQSSPSVPAGRVISQNPSAGSSVVAGFAVSIVVSTGPAPVNVPNVVGMTQATASAAIANAGLVLGTVTQQASASVPAGSVISQSPAGDTRVAAGSAVNIVVSSGPALVSVPNVVGLTQAAASSAITNAGFIVGAITQQSSATVPAGIVISQNPAGGTSSIAGSAVSLVVSTGPALVTVPNVVGLAQSAAAVAITNFGLVVGAITQQSSATVPVGSVINQNPAGGASVTAGTAVNLVVSSGPPNVQVPNVIGQTLANATSSITTAGLNTGTVTQQTSSSVPAGSVISQSPAAGANVAPGSSVNLTVSSGPPVSVPLPGSPTAPASGAAYDLLDVEAVRDLPAITLSSGRFVSSRVITIGSSPTATVGQLNALINSVNGRIVGMQSGTGIFVLLIPQPSSTAELEAVVAQLRTSQDLEFADFAGLGEPAALPSNVLPEQAESVVGAQIVARGASLWNLRQAFIPALSATLVVADCFEQGAPYTGPGVFNVRVLNPSDFVVRPSSTCNGHGYAVLGMVAADFGGGNSASERMTGLVGETVWMRGVEFDDARAQWPGRTLHIMDMGNLAIIRRLREIQGPIVLNTSLQYPNRPVDSVTAGEEAKHWLRLLRDETDYFEGRVSSLEQRMLHVTAAGNSPENANVNSWFAAAAKRPDLRTIYNVPVPPQANSLIVEDRQISTETDPITAGCELDDLSGTDGDVSAIGTVLSYRDPGLNIAPRGGTSYATPQVSALAVWLSGLERRLSIPEIKAFITRSAYEPCEGVTAGGEPATEGKNMIDAFGTALAADNNVPLQQAHVHRTLLDVVTREPVPEFNARVASGPPAEPTPDGRFTEFDVAHIALELLVRDGDIDFSRYDLNGDGATGGGFPLPFDLDRDGETTVIPVPGVPGLEYDEEEITDAQILCYYTLADGLFERISDNSGAQNVDVRRMALLPILSNCGIRLDRVLVQVGSTVEAVSGARMWTTPTNTELNTLATPLFYQGFWSGNPPFCSERGSPTFSSRVPTGAILFGAGGAPNAPVPEGEFGNRRPCSSFIAVSGLRIWANATAVMETFSGSVTANREFQTRLYYGADGTVQSFETGLSPTAAYLGHVPIANPTAAGFVERRGEAFSVNFVFVAQ